MIKTCMLLADGFEEVEALTVVDLLRRVEIDCEMISVQKTVSVRGTHNIRVQADRLLEDTVFDGYDAVILPGGLPGTTNLAENPAVCEAVLTHWRQGGLTAAICAAPTVLAGLGILEGKHAVCYPGMEPQLTGALPCDLPAVRDGNVITGRGVGAAIPFALEIVKALKNEETALSLAKSIVYPLQ